MSQATQQTITSALAATHAAVVVATRIAAEPSVGDLLAPFFPRWKGDASEPALPAPMPAKPAPAAAVRLCLEEALEAAIAALDAFDGDADLEEQWDAEEDHADCEMTVVHMRQHYPELVLA